MFKIVEVSDVIRIPPSMFGEDLEKVVKSLLKENYEDSVYEDLGYVIKVLDFDFNPVGKLVPSDGGSYHEVKFRLLVFTPELHELVEGEVVEVESFGCFVRVGPIDALLHVSQITDDYMSFNEVEGTLIGKESHKVIRKSDIVRARIVAVSIGKGGVGDKVGITTRQPFLGKLEWIEEEVKKSRRS